MMADYVPFDIQTIIIEKLPAKSLIRFRCVSKQWKSLIDSSKFIKSYQSMNDRRLLVRYCVDIDTGDDDIAFDIDEYVSMIDNDAFPEHTSPITVPSFERLRTIGSSYGVICFHGERYDYPINKPMVVFWNPSIRKSVSVLLEGSAALSDCFGFGACPETRDPKLVVISGFLEVQVYTLSTRAWKKVSLKPPYKPCGLCRHQDPGVCVEGFIYWLARDDNLAPSGKGSNYLVSFDMSNEEFGKVLYGPHSLQRSKWLTLSKWNECLTVCDYDCLSHWDVWMMKDDGVTQSFTMMFRIDSSHRVQKVLEFRKNGEAIITRGDDDNVDYPKLQVYDPCSRRVNNIRNLCSEQDDIKSTTLLSISSYMETLLLLDQ